MFLTEGVNLSGANTEGVFGAMKKIKIENLSVDENLVNFINKEVIPGTGITSENFWKNFSRVANKLAPINKSLLNERDIIQKKIDEWHKKNKGKSFDNKEYKEFLRSINYIVEEKEDFKVMTKNVDDEIASIAGPQLVVPVDNARYALNAANARWGSLYDCLYGTDVISDDGEAEKSKTYNPKRGLKVIKYVRQFLDEVFQIGRAHV